MTGHHIILLNEVDSTNDYLKERSYLGEWVAVLAHKQNAGRGRLGRSFYSAPGLGMYLSVLVEATEERVKFLTPAAAVAARRVVKALGADCGIKWVNDLVVEYDDAWKKLCGILVELRDGMAVVGVGLNLMHGEEDFPAALRPVCTSVKLEGGRLASPREAAAMFIRELQQALRDEEGVFGEYKAHCVTPGRAVEVRRTPLDLPIPARAIELERDYAMLVEFEDGRRESIRTGEASVR